MKLPLTTALIFLALVGALLAMFHDRSQWVDQQVGFINLDLVPSLQSACAGNILVEVAPGSTPETMAFRCGVIFYPFYKSGESGELAEAWAKATD